MYNKQVSLDLSEKPNWIPLKDFFSAYFDCRRRKRTTINALKFEVDYTDNLVKLWKEVNSKNYKIGKSITFIVTRPKLREVFAADFRDRVVHHVIMQRLEPLFEKVLIDDCYSCRKGKGTLYGVERLRDKIKECSNNYTENCWIGKFDIRGFFMSINKPLLWGMLKKFIEDNYFGPDKEMLLYVVKKVVLHRPQDNCIKKSNESFWYRLPSNKSLFTCHPDCGIPIGNLTSQCFANFYLNEFDRLMSDMFNGFYGRYVDDFYILAKTKEELTSKVGFIRKWLWNKLRLTLHPDKIYIQHYKKGVRFIGSVVKKNKIKAGSVIIGNIYSAIHRFNIIDNTKENAIEIVNTMNSYLGFMVHHDSYFRRRKLCLMLDRKWRGIIYFNKNYSKVRLAREYSEIKETKNSIRNNKHIALGKLFAVSLENIELDSLTVDELYEKEEVFLR